MSNQPRSRRFFLTVMTAVAAVLCCCILTAVAWRYQYAFRDPLALSNENAIFRAAELLIEDVAADNLFAEASERKLLAVMQKLNAGWTGFRVNGYYPFQYGSEDLLNSVYWRLGQAASRASGKPRERLVAVLRAVPPRRQDEDSKLAYRNVFTAHDLD